MLMRNMYLVLNICVLIYAYRKKSYTSGCLQKKPSPVSRKSGYFSVSNLLFALSLERKLKIFQERFMKSSS